MKTRWGVADSKARLYLLSTHDTTLRSFLSTLNITSPDCIKENYFKKGKETDVWDCPYTPLAANIVLELFKNEEDGVRSVRLSVDDRYYDVCSGEFTDKKNFKCKYEAFRDNLIYSKGDFNKFCFFAATASETHTRNLIAITFIAILVILVILVICASAKLARMKREFEADKISSALVVRSSDI